MAEDGFFIRKTVWVLNQIEGFGIQKFKTLLERLKDLRKLYNSQVLEELKRDPHYGVEFASSFEALVNSDGFERDEEQCVSKGIQILTYLDLSYPKNLCSIYDPPLVLYLKGNLILEDQAALAIVGSRYPTAYGIRSTAAFATRLAECGITVVSGFARGIDAEAHCSTLRAKGRTIAVLGCGLDVLYPKEHTSLYEKIAENGALLSEFPLGSLPYATHFPKRNRLISGLAFAVLVVEANLRSGSLITARLAAEEGREVYVVPGPIDSLTSSGTNHLIQEGAKLVVCVEDILEDLSPQIRACLKLDFAEKDKGNDGVDDPLLKLLGRKPLSFDEIALLTKQNPIEIKSRLTELELGGVVKRVFGGSYVRS